MDGPDWMEVLEFAAKQPEKARDIMQKHKFILDDLNEPWQKLAFTFYSMLVETGQKAEKIIEEAKEETP